MKSNPFRVFSILIAIAIIILLVNSCKKDPYQLGIGLLPPTDTLTVKTSDTASFVAYSVLQDSIRTDETTLSILGSMVDPVFGTTTAGLYMQYKLSAEAPDFGINPVLDSLILQIPYGTIYGDTSALQTLKIYEMSKSINVDSVYYSTSSVENYGIPLASYTYKPARYDSLLVGTSKVSPRIRISLTKLTNYFGNKLLSAPASDLRTNVNFLSFMKGLYIESSRAGYGGALMGFSPTDVNSNIVMYYHNDTVPQHFNFYCTSSCARFNHFDHYQYMNATPELRQQVVQKDTSLGKNNIYIQGLGGIRVRLRMPFLNTFGKSGKIAINEALMTFTNAETDTTLAPIARLTLVTVDTAGNVAFIGDENEGNSYFGGYYNPSAHVYRFRISRYMQQVIDGKRKLSDMYLMANDPSTNVLVPNRVMLTGTSPQNPLNSGNRISLQVIYTKLH